MSFNQLQPEMIDTIIDSKVEWIESDLKKRGLSYDRLIDDLLDHICCLVEEEMESGKNFDSSYSGVMNSIGENRLPEIEHQTLLLLDKKFQKMKNFTYKFGLISSFILLVGAIFKRLHFPGAGILITLSLFSIMFVFLPLYFYGNHKEQTEKKSLIYPIVAFITMISLLAAGVFKIQHWPGAGIMVEISMAILFVGFLPLYLVNAFQRANMKKLNLPYIVMVVVGLVLVSFLFYGGMAKDELETYRSEAILNEEKIVGIEARTEEILVSLEPGVSDEILQVHSKASELQTMIDEMLESILVSINEPGVSLEALEKIDKGGTGRDNIVDNGWARLFMEKSREYQDFLVRIIDDPVTQNQIEDHLEYNGTVWFNEWGASDVIYDPVIKLFYKNSDVSKGIALSEYVTVAYLVNKE